MKQLISFFALSIISSCLIAQDWNDHYRGALNSLDNDRFNEALTHAYKAKEIALNRSPVDSTLAYSYWLIGNILSDIDSFENSIIRYEEAIEAIKLTDLANKATHGILVGDKADTYRKVGSLAEAKEHFIVANRIIESDKNGAGISQSSLLSNWAILDTELGENDSAIFRLKHAISILEDAGVPDSVVYDTRKNNLALVYLYKGEHSKALTIWRDSRDRIRRLLGPKHSIYSNRLNNLAVVCFRLGLYDEAIEHLSEAISIMEGGRLNGSLEHANQLNNLGVILINNCSYDSAVNVLSKASDLISKKSGQRTHKYALCLNNIADAMVRPEQLDSAKVLFKRSLGIIEEVLGSDHYEYANVLVNLGEINLTKGSTSVAIDYFDKAMIILQETVTPHNNLYLLCRLLKAKALELEKESEEASHIFQEIISVRLNQSREIFPFLTAGGKNKFLISFRNELDAALAFLLRHPDTYPELQISCYESISNYKYAASSNDRMDIIKYLKTFQNSNDSVNHLIDDWIRARKEYAKVASKSNDQSSLDSLLAKIEQKELILNKSIKGLKGLREFKTWSDLRNGLKKGEIAAEYFSYSDLQEEGRRYCVFVSDGSATKPTLIKLAKVDTIENLLTRRTNNDEKEFIEQLYASRWLYKLLIEPIDQVTDRYSTLYFSPVEDIHLISFGGIRLPNDERLIERKKLFRLTSTLEVLSKKRFAPPNYVTLVGGVTYNAEPENQDDLKSNLSRASLSLTRYDISARGEKWTYLEGSELEVKSISALLEQEDIPFTIILGNDATEERIKDPSIDKSKILHLATHGYIFPYAEKAGEKSASIYQNTHNPLFRSGLALHGSNDAWTSGYNPYDADDGILTAYEISNLQLPNVDLAIVSACNSGIGQASAYSGVFGLTKAFNISGVENTIVSLWQISDQATAEFMEIFYLELLDGNSYHQALTGAQLKMAANPSYSAYHWAGFVLNGQIHETRTGSIWIQYGMAAVLFLVLTILIFFLSRNLSSPVVKDA